MTLIVNALAALLVIAGAISIVTGMPIIHLEQGWSAVIAGAVGGSAGLVIFTLGVLIRKVDALRVALEGRAVLGAEAQGAVEAATIPAEEGPEPGRSARPSASKSMPRATMPTFPVAEPEQVDSRPAVAERPTARMEPGFGSRPSPAADQNSTMRDVPSRPRQEPLRVQPDEPRPEPEPVRNDLGRNEADIPQPVPSTSPVVAAEPRQNNEAEGARKGNRLSSLLTRNVRPLVSGLAAQRSNQAPEPVEPTLKPLQTSVLPPTPAPSRTAIDLSSGWPEPQPVEKTEDDLTLSTAIAQPDEEPSHHEAHHGAEDYRAEPESAPVAAEEHADHPEPQSDEPTVVGRYAAGSASYIMYSNGMIEVETESGVHRFGSMQELKAFIEQQQQESARA